MSTLLGTLNSDEFEENIRAWEQQLCAKRRVQYPICSQLCKHCYPSTSIEFRNQLFEKVMQQLKKHRTRICQISGTELTEYMYIHQPTKTILCPDIFHCLQWEDKENCKCYWLFDCSLGRQIIQDRLDELISTTTSFEDAVECIKEMEPSALEYLLFMKHDRYELV